MTSILFRKLGVILAVFWGVLVPRLQADDSGDMAVAVKSAMAELMSEAAALGEARLDGSTLFFGSARVNGNYALVDALNAKHKCTATIFAKRGEGFVRISTNIIKDDGSRAVGTVLDPTGPAIAAIRQGQAFYGVADILGKKYRTGYEPVRNSAGEIIGIYYVGFLLP